LSILFIDLIFALVFRNVANSMQIYGLFSTKQALTNKKGVPRQLSAIECAPEDAFFRLLLYVFSFHLVLFSYCFTIARVFFRSVSVRLFVQTIQQFTFLVAKNCENLLQVCIFARRKGISTLHSCRLA